MNKAILDKEIQAFILANIHSNTNELLLKKPLFASVTNAEVVEQIEAAKRTIKKLPVWFETPLIYYPNKLNIEQTSSEETAIYKSQLVSGKSLVDITGGFGVDAYYFSKRVAEVIHCEINETLSDIVAHNLTALHTLNIQCVKGDGLGYVRNCEKRFDWIYVDPSRRNDAKGKVFMLADCLPDVPSNLDLLFEKSDNILIKTSPILDITNGLLELNHVAEIHVIAVQNEVKELLWVLKKGYEGRVQIITANIQADGLQKFTYDFAEEQDVVASYAEPLTFLYEPNAAIMKSGAFKTIGKQYGVAKLHAHSHLYTSTELLDFPGRRFEIKEVIPYQKKIVKQKLQNAKANIATRNFPDKPEVFKKQFKIKDGGEVYIFLTTDIRNKKVVLVTNKVN
ncbi:THUMP-like domain-containing protein [Neptunitalea lumnitzerae]|uniref:THUMP-like domain-containing protein n=1 Tax=Neptunitalea lumnitzerae TaxID=2965509 RepID=A0ABQ5MM86_9FLAO|nr:class I SAM-dependent methyltransferase [Neptunitalea sp. Y10]GLB50195.1 hypothetical protein Y10_25630 [Neptunitalea sp. Y10]